MASSTISRKKIEKDLTEILRHADLTQMSSKKVRRQLEEKYSEDLTDRKKEIDEILMKIIEQREKAQDEDSAVGGGGTNNDMCASISESDADSDFEEPDDMISQRPKKKPRNTQLDDEALARQLQEEEAGLSTRRTRGAATRRPPPKKTPQKKKTGETSSNSTKKKQGYLRENLLSPALAQILGTDRLPRNNIVKKMWDIAKERDLFDPKNKQFIICDDELYKVFRRKRVRMFGCMKYLADHILSPEEEDQIV